MTFRLFIERLYYNDQLVTDERTDGTNDSNLDTDDAREDSKVHQDSSRLKHQETRCDSKDNDDTDKTRVAAATVKVATGCPKKIVQQRLC